MARWRSSLHPRDARGRFKGKGGSLKKRYHRYAASYNRDRANVREREDARYVKLTGDAGTKQYRARFNAKNAQYRAKAARHSALAGRKV